MAHQTNRAKGDGPNTGAPGFTPAPTKKFVNPILTERVEPTGYANAKFLGASSVEPGSTVTSDLADELRRVAANSDAGDLIGRIAQRGTARGPAADVELASPQTRPKKSARPTASGAELRTKKAAPFRLSSACPKRSRCASRSNVKRWSNETRVELPYRYTGDEKIWWYYSLYLLCNRHVVDCVDDETVSSALNKMAARIELPFTH